MDIAPDLAEKVLNADLRNIIQKVTDGGTLTAGERELMRQFTLTQDMAKQTRIAALMSRWASGGRLTPGEIAEIQKHDPAFSGEQAAVNGSAAVDGASTETAFVLGDDPLPSRIQLTGEQLQRWSEVYGTERRQIRRWHNTGLEKKDPCPLDHPAEMPAWWGRCMKHRVPEKILAAASAAAAAMPPKIETSAGQSTEEKAANDGSATVPPPQAPPATPVDISGDGVSEGEAVQQARQIVKAAFDQLRAAGAAGDLNGMSLWQVRWEKSVETLRRQERDERAWQEQRGLLLPRAQLLAELAQMCEALRLMREGMPAKIIAELSKRAEGRQRRVLKLLEPAILEAVKRVRDRETDLLRTIESLNSQEVAAFALAAA